MKNTSMVLGLGAVVVTTALYSACSSGSGTPGATGGSTSVDTGGSTSASTSTTGGSTSASTSTSVSTGGTTPAATTSTAAPPIVVNSFDDSTAVGKFQTSNYLPTDCNVNIGGTNDAGGSVLVEWSGSVDVDADATKKGAMKITSTFTNWNQYWEVDMSAPTLSTGDAINLTNKLITVQFKITSGLSPNSSYPYGALLFVKTGTDYVWGASDWTNIESMSGFVTLTLDATNPKGVPTDKTWDPTAPMQLGIKLGTGGAGESPYCAQNYGAAFGVPQETVAYIDQIQISDRP